MLLTTADFVTPVLAVDFSVALVAGRDALVPRQTLVLAGSARTARGTGRWREQRAISVRHLVVLY